MRAALAGRLRQDLRRGATVLALVVLSVVTTLVVQRLTSLYPTAAQAPDLQEVRASAFVLVGPDGTVLARLAPGPTGNGNLSLYDTAGTRRMGLAGVGTINIFDAEGTTRLRLGYDQSAAGTPAENRSGPINGVQLDREGAISVIPVAP